VAEFGAWRKNQGIERDTTVILEVDQKRTHGTTKLLLWQGQGKSRIHLELSINHKHSFILYKNTLLKNVKHFYIFSSPQNPPLCKLPNRAIGAFRLAQTLFQAIANPSS
jgi:hypothetical protein